jgi:hypothetical protein
VSAGAKETAADIHAVATLQTGCQRYKRRRGERRSHHVTCERELNWETIFGRAVATCASVNTRDEHDGLAIAHNSLVQCDQEDCQQQAATKGTLSRQQRKRMRDDVREDDRQLAPSDIAVLWVDHRVRASDSFRVGVPGLGGGHGPDLAHASVRTIYRRLLVHFGRWHARRRRIAIGERRGARGDGTGHGATRRWRTESTGRVSCDALLTATATLFPA